MSISAINFRSAPVEMERMTTVSTPKKSENQSQLKMPSGLVQDVVELKCSKENAEEVFKKYSCKGADMLKYDLEYSKPSFFNRNYEITGDTIALSVKNKFGGQFINGTGYGEAIDINIKSGLFNTRKGTVTGKINGKELNLNYKANENAKSINISGNIDELDEKNKDLLIALISDKIQYDLRLEQEMEMVAMATTVR